MQLAQVHPDHPGTPELVTAAEAGSAFFEPEWWPAPPTRASERGQLRRVVMSTPSLPAAVGFFAGLLDGDVVDESADAVELVWPGGGRVRLEHGADTTPGFVRLEGDDAGAPRTLDLSGAPFVISPG